MKKCLVLKDFVDKETNEFFRKDSFYHSKDSKRVAFLEKEGYVKEEKQDKKPENDGE